MKATKTRPSKRKKRVPMVRDASSGPVTIYNRDCEGFEGIPDGSVALTVTSPPYWNAIDYDRHAEDSTKWYRTRAYTAAGEKYEEYLDWIARVFAGALTKTKPGGYCAIVIGTCLLEGRHYPVPFDITARLVHSGWEFHQDIIWHKVTGGVKRAGTFIQKPFPGYFYPNIMTEYLLVFRKPGEAIFKTRTKEEKEAARNPINRLFTMDVANTVWHIAPVPPGHLDHPCPFPEEIPYRLIRLYSYPGDLILDPFAGSGQTLKVAKHLGRRAVGYETLKKYCDYTRRRLDEPLAIRPMQLIAEFDKAPLDGPSVLIVKKAEAGPASGRRPRGRPKTDEPAPLSLFEAPTS